MHNEGVCWCHCDHPREWGRVNRGVKGWTYPPGGHRRSKKNDHLQGPRYMRKVDKVPRNGGEETTRSPLVMIISIEGWRLMDRRPMGPESREVSIAHPSVKPVLVSQIPLFAILRPGAVSQDPGLGVISTIRVNFLLIWAPPPAYEAPRAALRSAKRRLHRLVCRRRFLQSGAGVTPRYRSIRDRSQAGLSGSRVTEK